jgi:predicted 2-oxoglutarate/Fe(II)-dependent dioxygenase YbiX
MEKTKVNIDDVINSLLDFSSEKDMVLLFENSSTRRRVNEEIGNRLRQHPQFTVTKAIPFKVASNMIKVNKNNLYFGLTSDEDMLTEYYQEIKIYAEKK